jgi:hypothetical protein
MTRIAPGRYLDGLCVVERTDDGWRWYFTGDLSVGGEWRRTKREAVLDLRAWEQQVKQGLA